MRKMFILVVILLPILGGCGAENPELPPTATPKPTSCQEVDEICLELTFDGSSCTYKGPTDLEPGPVTLFFINASKEIASVDLVRNSEGHTIQDAIDHVGKGGSNVRRPSWATSLGSNRLVGPGKIYIWPSNLTAGIHYMVCLDNSAPHGVWFGTGLTVEE